MSWLPSVYSVLYTTPKPMKAAVASPQTGEPLPATEMFLYEVRLKQLVPPARPVTILSIMAGPWFFETTLFHAVFWPATTRQILKQK